MSEYHDTETGEVVSAFYARSAELNELFAALANAQGEFESAKRAGENPHFKSKYATLEAVLDATAEGRKNNKLALIQMPGNGDGNNIAVTTILGHSSGQWIESKFQVAPAKFDAQGAGSVVTYLRRYAAMSILGIAPEDDDGNAAVSVTAPATRGATRTAQPRPPTSAAAGAPNATSAAPPHTPSSTGNGTPKWIGDFLARESYEIDPQKAGGWSAWEKHYMRVAECTESFEQYAQLEGDNQEHVNKFATAVKREVFDDFLRRRRVIEAKYFPSHPPFVSQADAAEILQS